MNGMSREANELVSAGRQAFSPTEGDKARLMAALAGTAALSAGAAIAAAASERTLFSIFASAPARLLVFTLPLAAAGAYGWSVSGESPAAVPSVRPAIRVPAAVAAKLSAPAERGPEAPSAEPVSEPMAPAAPSLPTAPERSGASPTESSRRGVEIRQEVALLSKAQSALSRGRPQEALEALAEHARSFPRGALTEERSATRARTLCALGRRQEAEAELLRIERLNPTSAYLARARESCGSR